MSRGLKNSAVCAVAGLCALSLGLCIAGCGSDSATDPNSNYNPPNTVTDIDGNAYQIVTIGTQEWMAENLRVTRYRNGDTIPRVSDAGSWSGLTTGARCEYDNDTANVAVYGRLYNRFAVSDSRNIAPQGWHVPTFDDWQTLADYLGGDDVAGGKMKVTGTSYWITPNTGATNESGFTALPGGSRFPAGGYGNIGIVALWWSATGITIRSINNTSAYLFVASVNETGGLSIRCVKD